MTGLVERKPAMQRFRVGDRVVVIDHLYPGGSDQRLKCGEVLENSHLGKEVKVRLDGGWLNGIWFLKEELDFEGASDEQGE